MPDVRQWFRFSLREILLLTTIVAILIGWYLENQNKQTVIDALFRANRQKELMLQTEADTLKRRLFLAESMSERQTKHFVQQERELREEAEKVALQNIVLEKMVQKLQRQQ